MIKVKPVTYSEYANYIRQIRDIVFVNEQNVPKDIEYDGLDADAIHVIATFGHDYIGTGRMLTDGHIGRLAVLRQFRGQGVGRLIMECLMDTAKSMNVSEVWLSSQTHATGFYEKQGFTSFGDTYQEAGINHVKMNMCL